MKNLLLTSLITLCTSVPIKAQITFQKGYGGTQLEEARSIYETYNHGYIIAGQTLSFGQGDWDAYLVNTDSTGSIL